MSVLRVESLVLHLIYCNWMFFFVYQKRIINGSGGSKMTCDSFYNFFLQNNWKFSMGRYKKSIY